MRGFDGVCKLFYFLDIPTGLCTRTPNSSSVAIHTMQKATNQLKSKRTIVLDDSSSESGYSDESEVDG